MRRLTDQINSAAILITLCFITMKPIATGIHDELYLSTSQNSYSMVSFEINYPMH